MRENVVIVLAVKAVERSGVGPRGLIGGLKVDAAAVGDLRASEALKRARPTLCLEHAQAPRRFPEINGDAKTQANH